MERAGVIGARVRRAVLAALVLGLAPALQAQELPRLTQPVTDLAGVIGAAQAASIDARSRALQQQTGDAVVVVTVRSIAPFGDIREYAVRLFENHGAGIGARGQDNGLLVLLAVEERRVWIEVGYGLEPFVTDGFAGEVSRNVMVPFFRRGDFGGGLAAGVDRLIARIAEGRNVEITGLERPAAPAPGGSGFPAFLALVAVFLVLQFLSGLGRMRSRRRSVWGRRHTWSGWHSGVGPFGGGFGGGWGPRGGMGGGFGGGFGGFGGGRSGGGGGGASW